MKRVSRTHYTLDFQCLMICRVTPFLPPFPPPKKKGGNSRCMPHWCLYQPSVRARKLRLRLWIPSKMAGAGKSCLKALGCPETLQFGVDDWSLSPMYIQYVFIYIYVCVCMYAGHTYFWMVTRVITPIYIYIHIYIYIYVRHTFLEYEGWLEWGANKKIGKPIQKSFIWVATARCKNHCFHCCKNWLSELLDTFWICSVLLCCVMHSNTVTLPETNSSHLPQKPSQRKLVFQPRFFRGYVQLQGCTPPKINMSPERGPFQKGSTSSNHPFSGGILVYRIVNFGSQWKVRVS